MPDGDPFAAAGLVPVTAQPAPIASAPAGTPSGADPFAAAGLVPVAHVPAPSVAAPSPDAPITGHAANAAAGLLEGAGGALNVAADPFGNLIGRPAVTAALYVHDLLAPHFGWQRSTAEDRALLLGDDVPQPGTKLIDATSQAVAGRTPSDIKSGGLADDIIRAGVGGAAQMALMGPASGMRLLPSLAAGTGGALTGEAAAAVAPDYAKPMAELAGNAAGSIGALATPKVIGDVHAAIVDRTTGPGAGTPQPVLGADGQPIPLSTVTGDATHTQPIMATKRQLPLAGQKLVNAASDPVKATAALAAPVAPLVPGSEPTTFQATGDPGLGTFERVASANNPDIAITRQNLQNAARVGAVQDIGGGGDPAAVPAALKSRLDNMTAQYQQAAAGAQARVAGRIDAIGGATPPGGDATAMQTFGARMRGSEPVPGEGGAPDTPGTSLVGANAAAKARESALWKAIDPDGKLTVDMTPIRSQAQSLVAAMPQNAEPLAGKEGAIFDTASSLPPVQSFSELAALRSRLTDAISQERQAGNGATVGRLSQLLNGVHDAMAGAVTRKVAEDGQAVASGQMAPAESIMARLGTESDTAEKPATPLPGPARGGGGGLASATDAGSGPPFPVGPNGSGLPPEGGPGGAASDSLVAARPADEVAPSPAKPNFDAAAADRYQAARAATRDRHATFTNAPGVGPSIAPGRFAGEFKAPDSAVPGNIFTKGAAAAERVQAYAKAGGDLPALQDYAAFSLRKAAQTADGTLDPAKFAAWKQQHAEALGAVEKVIPGLTAKLDSVGSASAAVREATARAAENVKAFETSVAKHFLGGADPALAVGKVLEGPRSILDMRDLKAKLGNDPAALAGVRQAAVDYVLRQKVGNAAAGETGTSVIKSDRFQTFMAKAAPALKQIMTDDQVDVLKAVALDLQRANKSIAGTKLPGGSNTIQDKAAGIKHGPHGSSISSTLAMMAMEGIGFGAEAMHAHVIPALVTGLVGTYGAMKVKAMRDAGIQRVQDLAEMAAFSPPLAKVMMEKAAATKADAEAQLARFKVQLNRAVVLSAGRQYSGIGQQ